MDRIQELIHDIQNEVEYQFRIQDIRPRYEDMYQCFGNMIMFTIRLNEFDDKHLKLGPIKKALSKFGHVRQSSFRHNRLTSGERQVTFKIYLDDTNINESVVMQYYGVDREGKTKYVAMSEEQVKKYAKLHPEEGIVRVEDKFNNGYNLKESYPIRESLKVWDKKEFNDNSNTYELEMLYESVKTTLSAQQKNDLARFIRRAETAEEINTYMTGMLAQDQMNESKESLSEDALDDCGVYKIPVYKIQNDKTKYELRDRNGESITMNGIDIGNQFDPVDILTIAHEPGYIDTIVNVEFNAGKSFNESFSFNNLKELAYELDEYIEDKVWVRDFWFDGQFDNTISFEIYGDWKHDHARFDYYASEWLDNKGIDYKISEHITDEDGSDTYGAIHTIRIYNLKDNLEEDISSNSIKKTKYAVDAFTIVLNNLSDKLDGYEEFSDGEFDISYQGNKRELQREIIDTFAKADIELKREHNALVYSIPNNYDAYIYITKDDEASTYTKNSVGYFVRVETVL